MNEKKGKLIPRSTELLRYSSLGLEMGVAIAIGLVIGIYLDRRFGSSPWLTIIFFLLGVAAGFKNIIRLIIEEADKKENEERNSDRDNG